MKKLSLRAKLLVLSLLMAVVPVAAVGVVALTQMVSLGETAAESSYEGLKEQALAGMEAGIRGDHERAESMVSRAEMDARRLAGSATVQAYLTARQGNNDMLNAMARKELNRIAEGIVSTCKAQISAMADEEGLTTQRAQHLAAQQLLKVKIGKTGYVFVIDSECNAKVHPNENLVGKNLVTDIGLREFTEVSRERKAGEYGIISYDFEGRSKCVAYTYLPEWDWIICASAYWDELSVEAANSAGDLLLAELKAFQSDAEITLGGKNHALYRQARLISPEAVVFMDVQNGVARCPMTKLRSDEWFVEAGKLKEDEVFNSGVFVTCDDETTVRLAAPVYVDSKLAAVVAIDLEWSLVWERIKVSKYGKTGYPYIVNEQGVLASHPKYSLADSVNLGNSKYGELATMVRERMLPGESGQGQYMWEGRPKFAVFKPLEMGGKTYSIAASCWVDEFMAKANAIREENRQASASVVWLVIGIGVVVCVVGALAGFWMSNGISKPIQGIIDSLTAGGEQVSAASTEVAQASQSLAEGASEQAANVEESTASAEEVTSMIKANAEHAKDASEVSVRNTQSAQQARTLTQDASQAATEGTEAVGRMTEAISQIKEGAEETGRIVKTIDEIAFQTNLLALNAAVEAARAGEAGKGFAVVAEEVRNLAQRAGQAARETGELIEKSLKNSDRGVEVTSHVSESLTRIAGSIEQVTTVVDEVATASQEQTRIIEQVASGGEEQAKGIEQITSGLNEMDTVTQRNAASAEESASAAQELSGQAETLMATVRQLQAIIKGGSAPDSAVNFEEEFPLDEGRTAVGPGRPRQEAAPASPQEFQTSQDTQTCRKF
ncbi:MAG: methyl-accepting chemotaxis protein [Planctomycetota bacterium]